MGQQMMNQPPHFHSLMKIILLLILSVSPSIKSTLLLHYSNISGVFDFLLGYYILVSIIEALLAYVLQSKSGVLWIQHSSSVPSSSQYKSPDYR